MNLYNKKILLLFIAIVIVLLMFFAYTVPTSFLPILWLLYGLFNLKKAYDHHKMANKENYHWALMLSVLCFINAIIF